MVFDCADRSACVQVATLLSSDRFIGNLFGVALAISPQWLVAVGGAGLVNVFDCAKPGGCERISNLTAAEPDSWKSFGHSVAFFGSLLVIGALATQLGRMSSREWRISIAAQTRLTASRSPPWCPPMEPQATALGSLWRLGDTVVIGASDKDVAPMSGRDRRMCSTAAIPLPVMRPRCFVHLTAMTAIALEVMLQSKTVG